MIRFSKMADYGVLLLGQLAQAHGQEQELTSASDLAAALHMAPSVVSNLLKSFREHGLLESRRGASGGYRLCRPPEQISL
ncbi:MAG: SUF system Fe-S cluster assembly regulator, partial [Planctomycetota bacterium]